MLILTRRISESIVITTPTGVQVTVWILGIKGNQARVGIEAPKDITVDREEIYLRKTAGYDRETTDPR